MLRKQSNYTLVSTSIALAWTRQLPNLVRVWAVPADLENGTIKVAVMVNWTKNSAAVENMWKREACHAGNPSIRDPEKPSGLLVLRGTGSLCTIRCAK